MDFSYRDTILSQYANSPIILALLNLIDQWLNPDDLVAEWYADVWNIATAKGYGLQVWGRIVGVTNVITLPAYTNFGFTEGGGETFGQGVFFTGAPATQNFTLSDDAFRTLILFKALSNISGRSIPAMNTALRLLFTSQFVGLITGSVLTVTSFSQGASIVPGQNVIGSGVTILSQTSGAYGGIGTYALSAAPTPVPAGTALVSSLGNCYMADYGNMQAAMTFEFDPTPVQIAILQQSGALSGPTGVGTGIAIHPVPTTFGFKEAGYPSAVGFGQGTFYNGALSAS